MDLFKIGYKMTDSFDSASMIPDLIPLSRDYLREDELFDIPEVSDFTKILDIPDDLEDCRQVAQVVIPGSVMEIYYNYVLQAPFIQIHDEWMYFGDVDTTFRELFAHFGITATITWTEHPYKIGEVNVDEVSIDNVIAVAPPIIFETDEDYNGQCDEDDNY